jgi:hypothetical protein
MDAGVAQDCSDNEGFAPAAALLRRHAESYFPRCHVQRQKWILKASAANSIPKRYQRRFIQSSRPANRSVLSA